MRAGTGLSTKRQGWFPGRWNPLIDCSCRGTRELSTACHSRADLGYLVLRCAGPQEDQCAPCTGVQAALEHPSKPFPCRYEGYMLGEPCSHCVRKSGRGHFASVALLPLHSPICATDAILAPYEATSRRAGKGRRDWGEKGQLPTKGRGMERYRRVLTWLS